MLHGSVTQFDDAAGLGVIVDDDGRRYQFHCIEIEDGTRTIDPGQSVMFVPLPRLGQIQAGQIHKR
jgi:CspA family cold shock protein